MGLPLMKNVLKPLDKSVLIPLGLTAADTGIQKKIWICDTNIDNSNKEMENIKKIVKSREESALLVRGASETIKNEAK